MASFELKAYALIGAIVGALFALPAYILFGICEGVVKAVKHAIADYNETIAPFK